ncbi:MAG TPA: TadE family protein [Candidatus Sulfotelmatobacter sp.]|nr:TadE family protein [Candidatus Sulfotelmatobacter sp.]
MRSRRGIAALARNDSAAQIIEFAVSLPLLVVFVVGIFDFSGAYTLKNKLTHAAAEAARVGAAGPSNDLSNAHPASVADAFQSAHNYLLANKLNDCGITGPGTRSGLTLIWTFAPTGTCTTGLQKIIVDRGYSFAASGAATPANCAAQDPGGQVGVIGTCVSVQYAYQWRFGKVISVLVGANNYPGISTLTSAAVAANEN